LSLVIQSPGYELDIIKKAGEYQVKFDIEGEQYRLGVAGLIMFRVVQEALLTLLSMQGAAIIEVGIYLNPIYLL